MSARPHRRPRGAEADDPEEESGEPSATEAIDPEEEPRGAPSSSHPRRSAAARRPGSTHGRKGRDSHPTGGPRRREKRPVYWRARDSLWFEPLVALAIVIVLLVGLWAYTQNWPPVYVVESQSMQHGLTDQVGLINTGDLVLAQKVDPSTVVPYMVGLQTGYSTYGEYGDVLLYHPNGDDAVTPVIHRAIVYLQYNPGGTWSVPDLAPLACSAVAHPYYSVSSTVSGCGTNDLTGTLTLFGIGWQLVTVTIPLNSMGTASGFVTMGDNNFIPGDPGTGEPDQTFGISALVQPGWILGVARWMIPWFGAMKLLLEGDASMVPSQSWTYLGSSVALVVLAGLGTHLLWKRRTTDPDDEDPSEEGRAEGPRGARPWIGPGEDEEEEGDTDRTRHATSRRRIPRKELLRGHGRPGGRPRPAVRRPTKHVTEEETDEDSV